MTRARIVYTAGVFDLFHVGHMEILEQSRKLGDTLIVGVVTDDGAAAYKARPVIPQDERLRIIAAQKWVDAAFLQPGTDPTPVLEALTALGVKPDIMTHGDDWTRLREGMETLERLGIKFVTIPRRASPGGTTAIKERMRAV